MATSKRHIEGVTAKVATTRKPVVENRNYSRSDLVYYGIKQSA